MGGATRHESLKRRDSADPNLRQRGASAAALAPRTGTYAMALAALLLGACAFEGPWARQLTHAHAAAAAAATAAATQCVRQHGAEDAWRT